MPRRPLLAIAVLAAILHGVGIMRSPLPAQDGLKFLRVAREFHAKPWAQVVRGTDQHPLYPATIAAVQPLLRSFAGDGADSWRITAQVVSAMATLLLLLPLYALTRSLFDPATGLMAASLFVLLPLPFAVGHDTLSDPLALLCFATAMAFGAQALRSRSMRAALGCGLASGVGYLARPEVAIAPLAVIVAGLAPDAILLLRGRLAGRVMRLRSLAPLPIAFLAMVGSYALVKGEVSEKLALRRSVAISSVHDAPSSDRPELPPGLSDPRWDFSAKEESQAGRLGVGAAVVRLLARWSEAMGLILVPLAIFGVW
ncbi:MAG: hypothetical protein JWO68_4071, partial [Actinomycetia bacterium]|nr:hypothetical protein [Actinomycetes bacterium]